MEQKWHTRNVCIHPEEESFELLLFAVPEGANAASQHQRNLQSHHQTPTDANPYLITNKDTTSNMMAMDACKLLSTVPEKSTPGPQTLGSQSSASTTVLMQALVQQ